MTMLTRSISIPRPTRSVATRIRLLPSLKALYTFSRDSCTQHTRHGTGKGLRARESKVGYVRARTHKRTCTHTHSHTRTHTHTHGGVRLTWSMPRWMHTLGKLQSFNKPFNTLARLTFFTKMTTYTCLCTARCQSQALEVVVSGAKRAYNYCLSCHST